MTTVFFNEPLSPFHRETARLRLQTALDDAERQLGAHWELIVDGKPTPGDRVRESRNPADHQMVLGTVAQAGYSQVESAVQSAEVAARKWRNESAWTRAAVLDEIASRICARREMLAAQIILEVGKSWREADADVAETIDFCRFYSRRLLAIAEGTTRHTPGEENTCRYVPRGVTAVISPWNFPLAITAGMTVAPLAMGNTVIIKPAEQASLTAALFMELLSDLVPPGVVSFLPGVGEEVGRALVAHPSVATINFTGSLEVGLEIRAQAAALQPGQRCHKHVVAEMGGKNAIIVDDDADLDEAVIGVRDSAFSFQGQKCSACSRVVVLDRVYDSFVDRLRAATEGLTVGPPADPSYSMGPVIDQTAFDRISSVIRKARGQANCVLAGDPGEFQDRGFFIGPHIFDDVDPSGPLGQQEIFGPVLAVMRARSFEAAIDIANDTAFALTGGVFSRNPDRIEQAKNRFEVGNLYVNRSITGALVDRQPFGGMKLSGLGAKAGGADYLKQFGTPRTVTENTLRRGFAPDEPPHSPGLEASKNPKGAVHAQ